MDGDSRVALETLQNGEHALERRSASALELQRQEHSMHLQTVPERERMYNGSKLLQSFLDEQLVFASVCCV